MSVTLQDAVVSALQKRMKVLGYGTGTYGGEAPPFGGEYPLAAKAPSVAPAFRFFRPTDTNGELNDEVLADMLQQMVSGITGLDPTLVFPRWQPEPPNQPAFDKSWAAIGPNEGESRTRDVFPAQFHVTFQDDQGDDVVAEVVVRNQILAMLATFYGPGAEQNAELLAMGLGLEQNLYMLQLNGCALVEVQNSVTVPEKVKQRWLMRVDLPFRLRRQQIYTYPGANLSGVRATLFTDDGQAPRDVSVLPGYGKWTRYGRGPYVGK